MVGRKCFLVGSNGLLKKGNGGLRLGKVEIYFSKNEFGSCDIRVFLGAQYRFLNSDGAFEQPLGFSKLALVLKNRTQLMVNNSLKV